MQDSPSQEEQLRDLRDRLAHLEDLVQYQVRRIYALEQQGKSLPGSAPLPPPISLKAPVSAVPEHGESAGSPELDSQSATSFPLPASVLEERQRALSNESMESRIGANWLSKIGVVAIVLGMSFFLKYAIDNQWIGERGRVSLGIAVGLSFLFWGEKLSKKQYPAYGLTVLGGGIAILYFSVYAAFSFYQLLPQWFAFLLMLMITLTAVLGSLRYNAKIIAYLGLIGGFLTPVMLSTGRDNQVGLFSYILVLNLGILCLAYFKNWRDLNLTAFFFTHLIVLAWTSSFYTSSKLWKTELFLTLFFFLFAGMSSLYNLVHRLKSSFRDLVLILLNGSVYFLWTYLLLQPQYFDYLGFLAVLMAAFYAAFSRLVLRRSQQDTYLYLVFLGAGLTFLTLAVPIQLKQNWITMGWAVEAVILSWIGSRLDSLQTRTAGLLVMVLVIIRLLVYDSEFRPFPEAAVRLLLNRRSMTFTVAILSVLLIAHILSVYQRSRAVHIPLTGPAPAGSLEDLASLEQHLVTWLLILANFLVVFLVTTEILNYFRVLSQRESSYDIRRALRSQKQLAISTFWALYSIGLVVLGILRRYQAVRLLAIVLFGMTIVKVFLVDLSELERGYRIISFIGLGAILLAVSFLYQKHKDQISTFILK